MSNQESSVRFPETPNEERPCVCYSGFVYIGHIYLTDEGEEVEEIQAVPCRRGCGGGR